MLAEIRAADKGELFEARVARLLYWEGAVVRRRVNLESTFNEKFNVTDVDVLALRFSANLDVQVTAGECKTTEAKNAPSAADRLLWLSGIKVLVGADRALLATTRPASNVIRALATRLDTEVLDERDIARRERVLGLGSEAGYGSHDSSLIQPGKAVFQAAKRDDDLRRIYWFSRSELWLAPPILGLKKALGACRLLGSRWSERLPPEERRCVEYLAQDILVGLTVALVRIAGTAYRQPEDVFAGWLAERLAEGVADYRALEELSKSFDKLVLAVLSDAGVDPSRGVRALGSFMPQPPPYAESLTELLQRLAAAPGASANLPRLADWRYGNPGLGPRTAIAPIPDSDESDRLLRLVLAFLEGQIRVPGAMFDVGSAPEAKGATPPTEASHRVSGTLFGEELAESERIT